VKSSFERKIALLALSMAFSTGLVSSIPALADSGKADTSAATSRTPDADTILRKADEVRNPSESFSMVVDVESQNDDPARFEVMMQGKSKTLIRTKKPERDVGRSILMIDENMWAYVPNLKRSVRVSLNQKLTGQAANGDISRMRWHGDYDASIVKESPEQWLLDLQANKKGLTYERIQIWVAKEGFRPVKAEYQTKQGKTLKVANFGGYKSILGAQRPTKILIRDANDESKSSTLVIRDMKSEDFPNSLFNQNSLK
jgi:outer membrane lipoprotein-sorting protein